MKVVHVSFDFEVASWSDTDEGGHDPKRVAGVISAALHELRWGIALDPDDVVVEEREHSKRVPIRGELFDRRPR